MKQIVRFVFILLILPFPFLHAQELLHTNKIYSTEKSILSGKITDARTGEALAGASVSFPDLRMGTMSDDQGRYKIQNIPQGRHLIEISYTGYSSILETILVEENLQKDFALFSSYAEHEGVTVTGVSHATSVKKTPVPVTLIKKDDLMKGVSANIIDALTKVPGVSQISSGPAISKPVIRGLGYNRVVVVNDGIRQEGQQWGDEHGIEIDELNVAKVEILKGPASLMYGSDALAGVINILSVQPVAEGTTKGNLFASYQTNNRQRNVHADAGGNHNGFTWGINGTYKTAADYRNKFDGYVFNSKFNEKNIGAYIGLNKGWGFSHLYFSSYNQQLGLIEGERDDATGKFLKQVNANGAEGKEIAGENDFASTKPFIPRQQISHFKIATENTVHLKKGRIVFTTGFQQNKRDELGNVLDAAEKELSFNLKTVNYNLQYHFTDYAKWKTTIGVNGMQQANNNKGLEAMIPEYKLFDIGSFVFTQKAFGKTTFSGGIRFDSRSLHTNELKENAAIKFQHFSKQFFNISASAGISTEISKQVILKFNLARGFRAPAISELASNGAHEGTNRYEYGEQNLQSEKSVQADAGLDFSNEHFSLSANLFYNAVADFIYYRKLSSASGGDSLITNGADVLYAFQYDQNNAKLFGGELNVDLHPHPLHWLHIENTFSVVRGMISVEKDGSKNLPFIPAPRLVNQVRAELFAKGKTIKNLFIQVELDNTFAQNNPFTGYDTETKTPGYSLLNAGAGTEIVKKGKPIFTISFIASNITDVAWQSHLSRLKYAPLNLVTGRTGVFNMGRNFCVKLNVPFQFFAAEKKR